MQIFRVSEDHAVSARFLDNRRLSKQVLELYQIIRVCLGEMDIIEANTRYLHHPVVKKIYNDGSPYLIDATALLQAMDTEHRRRGGKRSLEFRNDLDDLYALIDDPGNKNRFNSRPLPPFYVYGEDRCETDEAYSKYESLLFEKWGNDMIPPRCNLK